jgi:iron complex outermembrane receptor protein
MPRRRNSTNQNLSSAPWLSPACGALALSVAPWLAVPASAQEAPAADTARVAEVVVMASRSGEALSAKVDAPLRDIPQSIQVISTKLIQDLVALRVEDVLQQVSGVARGNTSLNGDSFIFRGFSSSEFLRNGYPDRRPSLRDLAAIERVEVIKGPASALYGRSEPGGTLNFVTKEPLAAPYYSLSFLVDSFGYINPTADLSTVTSDGRLGVRVNASYQNGGNFRDFSFAHRNFGSAAISWRPDEKTRLLINLELMDDRRSWDRGLPSTAAGPAPVPISRLLSEPTDFRKVREKLFSYAVDRKLGAGWTLRNALVVSRSNSNNVRTRFLNNTLNLATGQIDRDRLGPRIGQEKQLAAQLEASGQLTGPGRIVHKVLLGASLDNYETRDNTFQGTRLVASNQINIYAPVYGNFVAQNFRENTRSVSKIKAKGVYAQDLIELTPSLKALFSLRYDESTSTSTNLLTGVRGAADSTGYSPRAGVVWQPSQAVSFYGSYSQSFVPVSGQDVTGKLFEPTVGKQVEAGVKSELFDHRLALSAAVFDIRKNNISVPDPANEGFSIQTGEVTSTGFELDARAAPLSGLSLTASLSVLDVRITKDTRPGALGRRPANVPNTSAGLWAGYDAPSGRLAGWGVGLGGNYVGRREVDDLGAPFTLAPYVRVDASLRYTSRQWRATLKLNNLFDKVHFVNGGVGNINGIYPGAPRNVTFAVSHWM